MRLSIAILTLTLLAAPVVAQADFELQTGSCTSSFPVGKGTPGDPEGISRDGNPGLVTVDSIANGLGFPTSGAQYLRVQSEDDAAGAGLGENLIAGTPPGPGNPFSGTQTEAYILITPGFAGVSLDWDFYTTEGPGSGFNDGMLIDIIDAACNQLAVLAFADTDTGTLSSLFDTGTCALGGEEATPNAGAAESVVNAPIPAGGAFIRIAVWNGADNFAGSEGIVDNVTFSGTPIPPSYPGTNEDLIQTVSTNGGPAVPVAGTTDMVNILGGDIVEIGISSPLGNFALIGDFVLIGSTQPTGAPLLPPFAGLQVALPTAFLLSGGNVLGIPQTLPSGGFNAAFPYAGTLTGTSLYLQGIVLIPTAANSIFASTNAVELVLM